MATYERRMGSGRRATERRHNGSSIINSYIDYSGSERRSGQDRRTIVDRRR